MCNSEHSDSAGQPEAHVLQHSLTSELLKGNLQAFLLLANLAVQDDHMR